MLNFGSNDTFNPKTPTKNTRNDKTFQNTPSNYFAILTEQKGTPYDTKNIFRKISKFAENRLDYFQPIDPKKGTDIRYNTITGSPERQVIKTSNGERELTKASIAVTVEYYDRPKNLQKCKELRILINTEKTPQILPAFRTLETKSIITFEVTKKDLQDYGQRKITQNKVCGGSAKKIVNEHLKNLREYLKTNEKTTPEKTANYAQKLIASIKNFITEMQHLHQHPFTFGGQNTQNSENFIDGRRVINLSFMKFCFEDRIEKYLRNNLTDKVKVTTTIFTDSNIKVSHSLIGLAMTYKMAFETNGHEFSIQATMPLLTPIANDPEIEKTIARAIREITDEFLKIHCIQLQSITKKRKRKNDNGDEENDDGCFHASKKVRIFSPSFPPPVTQEIQQQSPISKRLF